MITDVRAVLLYCSILSIVFFLTISPGRVRFAYICDTFLKTAKQFTRHQASLHRRTRPQFHAHRAKTNKGRQGRCCLRFQRGKT